MSLATLRTSTRSLEGINVPRSYSGLISTWHRVSGRNYVTRSLNIRSAPHLHNSTSNSTHNPSTLLYRNQVSHFHSTPKRLNTEETEEDLEPLPILPRPLGIPNIPSSLPKTWQEKRADLLDREKHLEKRRFLIKEAGKGYYEDLIKAVKGGYGGKMWLAPKAMIRADVSPNPNLAIIQIGHRLKTINMDLQKALYFPDIAGTSLTGEKQHTTSLCAGKISLVAIQSTQVADEHVKSFVKGLVNDYQSEPNFRFLQINLQENPLKAMVVRLSQGALRKTVPKEQHETYLISSQNMEMLRQPLGMENKHVGFVYLLDEDLKVRWAACGFAKEEETKALHQCVGILLKRLAETPSSASTVPT
ncbi:Mitochondrial ATPase complex subunit atp10 [Tulasnella sp. 419]|nr:Mitochondrial ATPase complex subunit atp10 [Tulasnella sp. 419]